MIHLGWVIFSNICFVVGVFIVCQWMFSAKTNGEPEQYAERLKRRIKRSESWKREDLENEIEDLL